ncbi:MAG: TFIIB-type zinc ribbon-containing protein [Ruminiclostridium sp.]
MSETKIDNLQSDLNSEGTPTTESISFKCPSCGGIMVFDPQGQSLKCEYCKNVISLEDTRQDPTAYGFDNDSELEPQVWGEKSHSVKCKSCGAQTVFDAYIVADKCPFCGNSNIQEEVISTGIMPESIIPFKVTVETAIGLYKKWLKGKWLAPSKLRKGVNNESVRLTGMYVPCWSFDANTSSFYTAMAGEYYYVTVYSTVTRNGKTERVAHQERRTRWYPVSGQYSEAFRNYIVDSSIHIDDNMLAKIQPYNMEELTPYKAEYLSGFKAERYSVDLKTGWETAKERLYTLIARGIETQINADEVAQLRFKTAYDSKKYKHILLPLWFSSFKYKEKAYGYMINGQTGKVDGRSPLSPWKVTALVAGILALMGLGYFFINMYTGR